MSSCVDSPKADRVAHWLHRTMLAIAVIFLVLHFVQLKADFPNDSPWMDWSKYTDEGWYSDAASRHFLFGHWYLQGDFNPAVALPVWPLLEAMVFRFTGVTIVAARALAVTCFAAMVLSLYWLMKRHSVLIGGSSKPALAAPLAIMFFCLSPFFFVFSRMALLEPPLAMFAVLALLAASFLVPWPGQSAGFRSLLRWCGPQVTLGLLLPTMVLTKTTAVALLPAVLFMVWHRAGYKAKQGFQLAALPTLMLVLFWASYLFLVVRPHYWEDYQYLYSANAYTGFRLQPLATVLANTFADGQWMGGVLYPAFFVAMLLALFARPQFFQNPLVPVFLLWAGGYFVFLAYHNNLQPRYYLLLAIPITVLSALAIDEFRRTETDHIPHSLRYVILTAVVIAISLPDALLQLSFLLHPQYSYVTAVNAVARLVRANKKQSNLILSVSGSDMTLMTGLPSIDDDFGTLDLDQRVREYRPGWYVAWNDIDDDKMDALTPLYHVVRVAAFPALDDPDRDQLILYRLDPATSVGLARRRRRKTPRPLRTNLGQQPTTTQLQH